MARISAILREEVSYGFSGGGAYSVNVQELGNRFEERDENWKYPKHEYSASFANIDVDSQQHLIHVFHACRGRRHSFKMRDWNDYQIRAQPISVRPGTTEPIQLYKVYWFEPAYTVRPVQAIDDRDFAPVIVDGAGDPVPGSFNLDTGEFSPDGEWTVGQYLLSCDFLVWVRFDDDLNEMTINGWRDHTADVSLREDPFPFFAQNVPESWDGDE